MQKSEQTIKKIWEKRDDETAKAFDAFCTYRNLPPSVRSIHRTYSIKYTKDTKQAPKFIKDWASQNDWVKRAEAWDAYRDQQTEAARIEDWEDFQENHRSFSEPELHPQLSECLRERRLPQWLRPSSGDSCSHIGGFPT